MTRSLARRLNRVEKTPVARPARRWRCIVRGPDDTDETLDAKIRDKIARGAASEHDRFLILCWEWGEQEADN